ncbi:MAG: MFS transporter [Pigmentiphaga sp.]|nr:MFS transporter [Pigmentiphaga sp.]
MFLQYFIQGSWYVTMGTYLGQTLHFTGVQIGLAYSTAAIAAMVSPVFIGVIADRFFSPNIVLSFLNIVGALMLFALTKITDFSLFFPVLLIYSICFMPTMSLTNAISLENLSHPAKEFSRVRLFGSIGWIAAGLIISKWGLEPFATPFLIGASISLFAGFFALIIPSKKPVKSVEKLSVSHILGFEAFKLMKEKSFLVLLLISTLICIPLAFYDSFTNLFITNIGIPNAAAAMSLGQVVEIIFLFSFPFFFAKLKYKGSISAAGIAWIVMYGFFALGALTGNNGFIFSVLPLHGFCFTFFFVAGQLYVDEKAPASLRNSAQGLLAFATYGVGKYAGTLIAGNVVNTNTSNGVYNWVLIWLIPLSITIIVLAAFIIFFKEKRITN